MTAVASVSNPSLIKVSTAVLISVRWRAFNRTPERVRKTSRFSPALAAGQRPVLGDLDHLGLLQLRQTPCGLLARDRKLLRPVRRDTIPSGHTVHRGQAGHRRGP